MADWDEDSPRLRENLTELLREIRDAAKRRDPLTLESARQWHRNMMNGLEVPSPEYVGNVNCVGGSSTVCLEAN